MGAIFGTDDVSGLINEVGGEVIISANTTVDGDLTVSGDLDFGDASVDVLTIDAPGQGEASAFNLSLINDTPATVSLNQYSPSLFMRGSGWKINATAESQYTDGRMFMGAGDFGANAIGTMTFQTRTNGGAWSSHFTLNQYGVQSNVATYLNENTIQASNRTLALNSTSDTGFKFSTPQTVDSLLFFLDSTSRSVIITDAVNSAKDHAHTAQANPTLFIHSVKDPDTANDEWVSFAHDGTDAQFNLGSGQYDFTGGNLIAGLASSITAVASRISSGSKLGVQNTNPTANNGEGMSFYDASGYTVASIGAINLDYNGTHGGDLIFLTRTDVAAVGVLTERLTLKSDGVLSLGSGEGGAIAATGSTFRAADIITGGAGNIAGADLTIAGGLGTGTGDVGQVIIQTPRVAAAGDNAHTLTTLMTLDADTVTVDGDLTSTSYTASAQSGFSAYRDTAQSIANETGSVLIFDTEVYDTLGEYDHATGIFTATVAGTYQCNWSVSLTTATYEIGEFMYTHILKNNLTTAGNSYYGQITRCEAAVTQGISSVGSCIFQLAIGDTLRVLAVHNQGAAVNCSANDKYNYFQVQKIA